MNCTVFAKNVFKGTLVLFFIAAIQIPGWAQYKVAPLPVTEPVVKTFAQGWVTSLNQQDYETFAMYYAERQVLEPWQTRLQSRRIIQARLIRLVWVRPAPEYEYQGVPLSGQAELVFEFYLDGIAEPLEETRQWSFTNVNGFLQLVADQRVEHSEEDEPTPVAGVDQFFPNLGETEQEMVYVDDAVDYGTYAPIQENVQLNIPPPPPADPEYLTLEQKTLNELHETLLPKFQRAFDLRNEVLFRACFVSQPEKSMETFRRIIDSNRKLRVTQIYVEPHTLKVRGGVCRFNLRYALEGPNISPDRVANAKIGAIKRGSQWYIARFGSEVLTAPPFYPQSMMGQRGQVTLSGEIWDNF